MKFQATTTLTRAASGLADGLATPQQARGGAVHGLDDAPADAVVGEGVDVRRAAHRHQAVFGVVAVEPAAVGGEVAIGVVGEGGPVPGGQLVQGVDGAGRAGLVGQVVGRVLRVLQRLLAAVGQHQAIGATRQVEPVVGGGLGKIIVSDPITPWGGVRHPKLHAEGGS